MEIIWQLNELNKFHLRNQTKGSLFPKALRWSDFQMANKDGLDQIYSILSKYRLSPVVARVNFDLEIFLNIVRLHVKKSIFVYEILLEEDIVRNALSYEELKDEKEKWNQIMSRERKDQ